jgi:GntR family transcriptional regulator
VFNGCIDVASHNQVMGHLPMTTLRSTTLYSQVRDELARHIAEQKYPTGATLPSELDLADEMGVSVGTVRKALDLLRAERVVIRSQGRGTIVAGASSPDFRGKFDRIRNGDGSPVTWRFEILKRKVRRADPAERVILNLDEDEDIVELVRLRRAGDRPIKREHCCIPLSAFGDLSEHNAAETTIESLAYRTGVMISLLDERISIERADTTLASQFSVPEGSSLLRLERLVFDGAERPLEWRITYCHLDGYRYHAAASVNSWQPTPRRAVRAIELPPDPRGWRRELA